jgi:hypothetical protein
MTNQPTSLWLNRNGLGANCVAWSQNPSLRDALAWYHSLLRIG